MDAPKDEVLEVLAELRRLYPDWRIGQMICNVAYWARGAKQGAVWDITDEEFVATAREHIWSRRGKNQAA